MLRPKATQADRALAISNAINTVFPEAKQIQCWNHIDRKFVNGTFPGVNQATGKSYHRAIEAIKNCRTEAQARAVSQVVLNHMRERNLVKTAANLENEYMSERWFTWYIGCVEPGMTPSTNAIESWNGVMKKYPGVASVNKPTDTLLETVFPTILRRDKDTRTGLVSVKQPEILPSEYVAQAKELPTRKSFLVHNSCFYVKTDWTTQLRDNLVTEHWIRDVESGLKGDIGPNTRLKTVRERYLGLCKVCPSVVNDGMLPQCDCDLYNLYLCCPHNIFVASKLNLVDLDFLTGGIGRVRKVGAPPKNKNRYHRQYEEGPIDSKKGKVNMRK